MEQRRTPESPAGAAGGQGPIGEGPQLDGVVTDFASLP